jgi:gamma-glutamyltranspeptidase/glutathione hydrolase
MVIDYRETAPAAATVDMFAGGVTSQYPLVGVPGTVRGLELAHKKFGKLAWMQVVSPAVAQARDGVVVSEQLAASLNDAIEKRRDNAAFIETFGKEKKEKNVENRWRAGDRLVQRDLAETLRRIATAGADAFYTGTIADQIDAEMKRGGGLVTKVDLATYRARERAAVHGTFRGFDIYAPPPPTSGGITLVQMLNLAELFDLRKYDRWSPRTLHIMIEAMRQAYCERARYLGDADFVDVPARLTTKEYARQAASRISPDRASSSAAIGADILSSAEGTQTTHFSIVDENGMAVANTYTLEQSYGSGIVVRGAGFLLNNEMGDFNPQPGVTTTSGRIGTTPNLVAPGKRMLSSMCPTVVARDGRAVLVTGSPGGRTIINTVFEVVVNVLEYEMPLRDAVDAPRFHHGWMPDVVRVEARLQNQHRDALAGLRAMGHAIDEKPFEQGDAHSIHIDLATGRRLGVADRRRGGWAAGQ